LAGVRSGVCLISHLRCGLPGSGLLSQENELIHDTAWNWPCADLLLSHLHVESDKFSPSQSAAHTAFVGLFSAGPFLGSSSRSLNYFKSLKEMHVSQSFISTNSFKHFVCICSCFPECETKLQFLLVTANENTSHTGC
jgi:hypothetical protein